MEQTDYQALLRPALRFFFLQRCGCALSEADGGAYAHAACHTAIARIIGTGETRDVSGGWHDAGDYGRYVVPCAKAVTDLLLAYRANPALFADGTGVFASGDGMPDILREARYALDWLCKMQRGDGAVYHKVTCADFCDFTPPDAERAPLLVSPISTAATGDFAGALALAYVSFSPFDPAFAQVCLSAAKRAYAFLMSAAPSPFTNPPGITTGEYDDARDTDERFFAAASLAAATGERAYAEAALLLFANDFPLALGWADMGGYGALLCLCANAPVPSALRDVCRAGLLTKADRLAVNAARDPYGISLCGEYLWGSNMYLTNNAILLCEAFRLTADKRYIASARRHLDYLLGNNPLSMCYITGHCDRSPRHPHHRPSVAAKAAMPGMLVGGPDAGLHDPCARARCIGRPGAECYVDETESYSTNEVAVYWNSALIGLVARLAVPRF